MKRILSFIFMLLSTPLHATVTYPLNATLVWDLPAPNSDPTQAVTSYVITFNGVVTERTVSQVCNQTECTFAFQIPNSNAQTISVAGKNVWDTSTPVTITFTATAPGKSNNVKIRVP